MVEQRVINNTLVLLITMQLKINKTYVTTYKTVIKTKKQYNKSLYVYTT